MYIQATHTHIHTQTSAFMLFSAIFHLALHSARASLSREASSRMFARAVFSRSRSSRAFDSMLCIGCMYVHVHVCLQHEWRVTYYLIRMDTYHEYSMCMYIVFLTLCISNECLCKGKTWRFFIEYTHTHTHINHSQFRHFSLFNYLPSTGYSILHSCICIHHLAFFELELQI
jgi:hypothetical protein